MPGGVCSIKAAKWRLMWSAFQATISSASELRS